MRASQDRSRRTFDREIAFQRRTNALHPEPCVRAHESNPFDSHGRSILACTYTPKVDIRSVTSGMQTRGTNPPLEKRTDPRGLGPETENNRRIESAGSFNWSGGCFMANIVPGPDLAHECPLAFLGERNSGHQGAKEPKSFSNTARLFTEPTVRLPAPAMAIFPKSFLQ